MKTLFNLDIQNYDENDLVNKRPSVRGIIFKDQYVALVYSQKYGYYKFPGGGVNIGETYLETLKREIKEETGILIDDNIEPFGKVLRRQKSKTGIFEQENYYYFCNIHKEGALRKLDQYEADEGFELRFVEPMDAIKVNRACKDIDDFYAVMVERDTRILEMFMEMDPIPTIRFATFLLEEGNKHNPGDWLMHSYNVALAASKIAKCSQMDAEKAYIFGLLHDIGRKTGYTYMKHVIDGYDYMMSLGYESVARICMTHSFNLQDIHDYIGKIDVTKEQYDTIESYITSIEYHDDDYLIALADSIGMHTGIVDIIERMSDVKRRHGNYPESKWNQNLYLKSYFEQKAGKTIEEMVNEPFAL